MTKCHISNFEYKAKIFLFDFPEKIVTNEEKEKIMIHPQNPLRITSNIEIQTTVARSILLFDSSNLLSDFIASELSENMEHSPDWLLASYETLKNNEVNHPLSVLMNLIIEVNPDWIKTTWLDTNQTNEIQKHFGAVLAKRPNLIPYFTSQNSDISLFYALFDKLFLKIFLLVECFSDDFIELCFE